MAVNATAFLPFAHRLADASGAAICPYFGRAVDVETKADNSPVSIADREAEAAIRTLIAAHYPEHEIFGEEFGSSLVIPAKAGISSPEVDSRFRGNDKMYTWVIDPIDGTRAFLAGGKEWGTLIALCEDGVPILGLLDQPVTGERWVGVRGNVTHFQTRHSSGSWNPSVSLSPESKMDSHLRGNDKKRKLAAAAISTTSAGYFTAPQAVQFAALAEQCKTVIENGDCYAYGLLARGERDLVVDAGLKPYDILALVPIIEGAGGIITGWDGAPITLENYANVLAAGDAALHKEALVFLQKSL